MWLLKLLVVKRDNFLHEAGILHGYSLVIRWLLVGYSFMLCCSCSMLLFNRYPIKEDSDLDKTFGVSRGGCRGLPLLPMQHPEMAHINFQSSVFVSEKTVNKILKLDQN